MAKYKAMSAKKKSQVRSADPDAIRATVYFPGNGVLHESMSLATKSERNVQRTERASRKGPREYQRVTMSAVIIRACEEFIATHYPKFRRRTRKAA